MRIPYAPHTSYLRETLRFLSRRGMGREGTRGWAGNSRPAPTAPPLPRAQWQILKIDRNVIFFCKPHINDAARRIVILLHGSHLWGPYGFPNDAARRVATIFEKWNCLIETYLPVRRGSYKRLNLSGPFAAVSFWNTAVSNLFSRFSEDVATRRAASLSSFMPPTYGDPTVFPTTRRRYPPIRRSR